MTAELKEDLHTYLKGAREALLWKLDGLSEYDVRRPLTRTGTNLLGLVKHLTTVEMLYLSWAFGRPYGEPVPWFDPDTDGENTEPNFDLWARADESREFIVKTYMRICEQSDATIHELGLDAQGFVPWFGEKYRQPALHRVLVHVLAEVERHLGHADIVRELVDGTAGLEEGNDFLPQFDQAWWEAYRGRLQAIADTARRA